MFVFIIHNAFQKIWRNYESQSACLLALDRGHFAYIRTDRISNRIMSDPVPA